LLIVSETIDVGQRFSIRDSLHGRILSQMGRKVKLPKWNEGGMMG
jgi:hypothetical protein